MIFFEVLENCQAIPDGTRSIVGRRKGTAAGLHRGRMKGFLTADFPDE
jgi:hypothetical protein